VFIEGSTRSIGDTSALSLSAGLRLAVVAGVLLYITSFNYVYVRWISYIWGYLGPTYRTPDPALLTLGYALAALLCVLSPLKIGRPSQVIYWLLYATVYIPGLFVPIFMQLDNGFILLLIQLSMTGGMLLIALSYRIRLINLRGFRIENRLFWLLFFIVFVPACIALIVAFGTTLHISSLAEVYSTRKSASKVAAENGGIAYISSLLSNVMNPFLIAYGIKQRRRDLAALGLLGQVLVYATAALKSVLLSPIVIVLFYYSVIKDKGWWVPKMFFMLAGLFLVLIVFAEGVSSGPIFELAAIVLLRSVALPGVFIAQYQYFFEHFPHTYLSHIHGVNLILSNPYHYQLGQEIGGYYQGSSSSGGVMDSNASFFAFDGIAGFGLPGILIMSILCAFTFWALDSCARRNGIAFAAASLTMCAISLTNSSLFTTFLGGGIMVWMILFLVMPLDFSESYTAPQR
jgi:hypothetical protein